MNEKELNKEFMSLKQTNKQTQSDSSLRMPFTLLYEVCLIPEQKNKTLNRGKKKVFSLKETELSTSNAKLRGTIKKLLALS